MEYNMMTEYTYPENGKYITEVGDSYKLRKQYLKNGKNIQLYFGTFHDYNEAINYRDKCVRENWDESLILRKHNPDMKYIKKTRNGRYTINKRINGKMTHFNTFTNLIDAINERDLLIKYNWDYDLLCEHDERLCGVTIINGKIKGGL